MRKFLLFSSNDRKEFLQPVGSVMSLLLALLLSYSGFAQQANVGVCNPATPTPWVNGGSPSFTVTQTSSATPLLGTWDTGIFPFNTNTAGRAIDNNLTNFATGTITGIGDVTMRVTDATNTYDIGNFAGFKVNTASFAAIGANLTIKTYNNGTLQESKGIPLQGGDFNAGFITTKQYDAIELVFGLGLAGSINVYHAVNAKVCAGPALPQCSIPTALTSPAYPLILKSGTLGVLPIGSGVSAAANVTNTQLTDFATIDGGTGTGYITVKDEVTDYPAGTFAGYDIENIDFVTNKFGGITITTYLDGVQQEQSGVFNVLLLASSGQSLVANATPTATGRQTVGFVASKAFDEVAIGYAKPFGGQTKVYSVIVDARCSGANLACNTSADFTYPSFPVGEYSGQFGGCVSTLVGQGALVSADTSDYVSFIEGVQVGCTSYVGVVNNRAGDIYPAGTFAGFETAAYGLVSISVADLGTVTTYLNGVQQETSTTANLIATSFITGRKRIIGFKTTKDFDEIRYTRIGVAGISTGETRVYKAVVEKVCPGPALVCNEPTRWNKPSFPLTTYSYMVPYGVVVGCAGTVTGEDALTTADPNDFALLTMVQSLGCLRYVGVRDASGTGQPAGTYVSVEIENMSLITASVGDLQSIVTYKNGVEQERKSKGGLITATVLTGGRQNFGFVTTKDFDEVRYEEFTVITPATLVATRVYGISLMKLCDGPALACTTAPVPKPVPAKLNLPGAMNGNSGYPVTVESEASDAFLGVGVCTNQLLNPERVVTADTTDFATVAATGVNCWASITVTDQKATYPAGTFAGFDVFNSTAINLDLLGGTFITTYLDGAVQESKSANNLLLDLIGSTGIATSSRRRIGFVTTKPFDAIKYSQGQLVGINLGSTQVYGAVISKVAADCPPAAGLTLANPPSSATTATTGQAKTGNAATELTPSGGTAPYTYSNGSSDPACVAPVGATALTGVTVNANGSYSYTAPATAGTYYFCVKVCDATTPTPICAVKVYTVTVSNPAGSPITLGTPPTSATSATTGAPKSGNAATDLTPTGGTAPYTYSNGSSDPACVAPVGATALTGVTINANGTYNYTAPATAGTYFYCVKVCDATTPTPNCAVKVYTVNVTGPGCAAGNTAPNVN
jgi:trimeric autotransporter adhesin